MIINFRAEEVMGERTGGINDETQKNKSSKDEKDYKKKFKTEVSSLIINRK